LKKKEINFLPANSAKPRVLFFDHTAAMGGGEIALLNLVRNLDTKKLEAVVLLGAEGPLADLLREEIETYVLPLDRRVATIRKDSLGIATLLQISTIFKTMSYILRVTSFIIRQKITIIHTNSLKADIIGGIAGRLAYRPVVWHVRDRIEKDYLPAKTVRIFRILCRWIPNYVIANSAATLKTLRLSGKKGATSIASGVDLKSHVQVVHDGTAVVASMVRLPLTSEQFCIGLIGRISPWKGQHIFLEAAARVRERFPKAIFLIIGAALFDETAYEQQIRQLSTKLKLDDAVFFTGFCNNIKDAIAGLDLVVHASTTGEPFGQVIIEGMAAGKAVVATNGGGVPEIVEDGKTGLLVPMGDVQAMADAICQVLSSPALAREMGMRAKERIERDFTIQQTARKVEAVYAQILPRLSG
jgi:glycosyltransferase involved in cell wall biosynthesis